MDFKVLSIGENEAVLSIVILLVAFQYDRSGKLRCGIDLLI